MTRDQTSETSSSPVSARLGEGFLSDAWYIAAPGRALEPGRMHGRTLLGRRLVLGRTWSGEPYALADRCAHRGVPLSAGKVCRTATGDVIECPYHGWRFSSDGACVNIPAHPDARQNERIRVPSYPVVEQQGLVWIWMGADAPDSAPPTFPGIADAAPLLTLEIDYPVHIDHAILGLVDPAHGPVVHRQWWWRKAAPRRTKTKSFVPSELGFTMQPHAPPAGGRLYSLLGGAPTTEIVFRLPGLRWEHVRSGSGAVLALSAMTPLTEDSTRMSQIIWTDIPMARLALPLIARAARKFLREDEAVLAAQSVGLTDDPPFLWVGDADQQARWYLQLKREWMASRRHGRPFSNPISPRSLSWVS